MASTSRSWPQSGSVISGSSIGLRFRLKHSPPFLTQQLLRSRQTQAFTWTENEEHLVLIPKVRSLIESSGWGMTDLKIYPEYWASNVKYPNRVPRTICQRLHFSEVKLRRSSKTLPTIRAYPFALSLNLRLRVAYIMWCGSAAKLPPFTFCNLLGQTMPDRDFQSDSVGVRLQVRLCITSRSLA